MKLELVTSISPFLSPGAIDRAINSFIKDSRVRTNNFNGCRQQLTDAIASAVIFKNNPSLFLWLAEDNGEVASFALCHVDKSVDNELCYWATDAWTHPKYRHTPLPKQWFKQIREHAEKLMCKHILIPSSREPKAYCRFLGEGWKPYLTILKKDI